MFTGSGFLISICPPRITVSVCHIRIVTIWMMEKYTGLTKFITLFPDKEG